MVRKHGAKKARQAGRWVGLLLDDEVRMRAAIFFDDFAQCHCPFFVAPFITFGLQNHNAPDINLFHGLPLGLTAPVCTGALGITRLFL